MENPFSLKNIHLTKKLNWKLKRIMTLENAFIRTFDMINCGSLAL